MRQEYNRCAFNENPQECGCGPGNENCDLTDQPVWGFKTMRLASANRLRWAGLGTAVVLAMAAIVIAVIWHQNVVPQKRP